MGIGSQTAPQCPSRGGCESYIRWLHARFGVSIQNVLWLWLPEGVSAIDNSAGPTNGVLTRSLVVQAEPVAEAGRPQQDSTLRTQRFRCRSCQVLTHAEVRDTDSVNNKRDSANSNNTRVALVCSYELIRRAKASGESTVGPVPPECWGGPRGYQNPNNGDGGGKRLTVSKWRRPPKRLLDARLEDVVLPHAQPDPQDFS